MLSGVPLPPRGSLTERAAEYAYPDNPRTMRLLNRLLAPWAQRLWPLDPQRIKQRATRRTGLTDFGDGAPLDEPLEILCRSYDTEAQLHPMGRLSITSQLTAHLSTRLRLEDLARRHPEVFAAEVAQPVVIAGILRSGTTFLHRLLARDTRWRTAPFWELMDPLPAKGDRFDPTGDPRIRSGANALRFVYWATPRMRDIHEMINDEPDEELPLLALGHASTLFENIAPVPSYMDWYARTDHTDGYRYLKRCLQAMQWSRPCGDRWVLKAPPHLEMLRELRTVFPDSVIVQTHRDPVTSVISLSSLVCYATRINVYNPNPLLVGKLSADFVERLLKAGCRDRSGSDQRYLDIRFADLIADPLRAVRQIYRVADRELTGPAEAAMLDYVAAQRRGRGRHKYAAEDFGLDVASLRERFAFYYERFPEVPKEPW